MIGLRKALILLMGVAVLCALLIVGWASRESVNKQNEAAGELNNNSEPVAASLSAVDEVSPSRIERVAEKKLALLASSDDAQASGPPIADDEAQELESRIAHYAEWASLAGFATSNTDSTYTPLPVDDLVNMAKQGDWLASYWAGYKLAHAGELEEARSILINAVADGSIGAAHLLHNIYLGSLGNEADVTEALAWIRIAEAMGIGPYSFHPRLSPEDQWVADQLFHLYWSEVQRRHWEKYGFSIPYNPSPYRPENMEN